MNKSKIAILGIGGNAKSIINSLLSQDDMNISLYEDKNFKKDELFFNIPVKKFSPEVINQYEKFFISSGDNAERAAIFNKYFSEVNKEFPNIVHSSAIVSKNAILGHGNFIGALAFVGPDCNIGNFNIINTSSVAEHDVSIKNFNHLAPNATLCGNAKIDSNVLVGAGSTVIQNIKIASYSTIGASSLVIDDITLKNKVWAGTPVRQL